MTRLRRILPPLALALVLLMGQANGALIWGVDSTVSAATALVNFDPWTGAEVKRLPLPTLNIGDQDIGLAGYGTNELYYVNGDQDPGEVYVLSPADGSIIRQFSISGGWNVNGLGYAKQNPADPGYLYTSGCSVNDMHRYLASNGSSPNYFWGSHSVHDAVGGDFGGRIFAPQTGTNWICEFQAFSDSSVQKFQASFALDIVGMAYDGTYLYASTRQSTVYVMDPDVGTVLHAQQMPYSLWALASSEGLAPGSIRVIKELVPGAVALDDWLFTLYDDAGAMLAEMTIAAAGGDGVFTGLDPGIYRVAETTQGDCWVRGATGAWVAGNDYLVTVDVDTRTNLWFLNDPGGEPVIPEPATLSLLGLGLLGFVRKRRK